MCFKIGQFPVKADCTMTQLTGQAFELLWIYIGPILSHALLHVAISSAERITRNVELLATQMAGQGSILKYDRHIFPEIFMINIINLS